MHAKPSFVHRLQAAKMASSRTGAQNNGPRAEYNRPRVSSVSLYSVKCSKHGLRDFIDAVQRHLATQAVTMLTSC